MSNDTRFYMGWGSVIAVFACVGISYQQNWVEGYALLGLFLAISGLALALLSTMKPWEPMLAGGGVASLLLGTAIAAASYDLADAVLLVFILILIAGLALIVMGLKGR